MHHSLHNSVQVRTPPQCMFGSANHTSDNISQLEALSHIPLITVIDLDNGLVPNRHQAIIWTIDGQVWMDLHQNMALDRHIWNPTAEITIISSKTSGFISWGWQVFPWIKQSCDLIQALHIWVNLSKSLFQKSSCGNSGAYNPLMCFIPVLLHKTCTSMPVVCTGTLSSVAWWVDCYTVLLCWQWDHQVIWDMASSALFAMYLQFLLSIEYSAFWWSHTHHESLVNNIVNKDQIWGYRCN